MSKFNKLAIAAILGVSTFVGTASAATITFGGVEASDGSGLTSTFIDPMDAQGTNGFFIETFDQSDEFPDPQIGFNDPGFDDVCGVNSGSGSLPGVSVSPTPAENDVTQVLGVRQGTVPNVAAAPANDETCFGYVSNANIDGAAEVSFDYSVLLDLAEDTGITYLGFYWGSVDSFNNFEFFADGVQVASISGSELLAELGGQSGDQQGEGSNAFVNIFFDLDEQFDQVVFSTTGVAAEFDNIVIGLSSATFEVPAPTGLAVMSLGLILLSIRSRLKK